MHAKMGESFIRVALLLEVHFLLLFATISNWNLSSQNHSKSRVQSNCIPVANAMRFYLLINSQFVCVVQITLGRSRSLVTLSSCSSSSSSRKWTICYSSISESHFPVKKKIPISSPPQNVFLIAVLNYFFPSLELPVCTILSLPSFLFPCEANIKGIEWNVAPAPANVWSISNLTRKA